jgi:hypothetical protein
VRPETSRASGIHLKPPCFRTGAFLLTPMASAISQGWAARPGRWLLPLAGFVLIGGIVAEMINVIIGAVILLLVIGLFKKA